MFDKIAADLAKIIASEQYQIKKREVIKAAKNRGFSLAQLKAVENSPQYILQYDENSSTDQNRIYCLVQTFADVFPTAINVNDYFPDGLFADTHSDESVIFDAVQLANNQFLSYASVRQIGEWYNQHKLLIEYPKLHGVANLSQFRILRGKVADITNSLKEGKYYFDELRISVPDARYEDGKLYLSDAAYVVSGKHRTVACSQVYNARVDVDSEVLDNKFPVVINIASEKEVIQILRQLDQIRVSVRKVTPEQSREISILDYILEPEHGLSQSIRRNFTKDAGVPGTFSFSNTYLVLGWYYNNENSIESVGKWLIEFFNEFGDLYPNEIADTRRSLKYSSMFRCIAIAWLMYLSSRIQQDLIRDPDFEWRKVLRGVLNGINWDNDDRVGDLQNNISVLARINLINKISIEKFFGDRYDKEKDNI